MRVDCQVRQHRGLRDREREPRHEYDQHARPAKKDAQLAQSRPRRRRGARRAGGRAIDQQRDRRRDQRERAAGDQRRAPPRGERQRRQRQRAGEAAEREPRLLDAHGEAASARRKPLEHRLAGRGIEHAEAEARENETGEQRGEAARERGGEHERADHGLASAERQTHAETISEPARRQRHQDAAEIDRGQQQTDLRAAQGERVAQERRERSDGEHGERAERMGHSDQDQDGPAGHAAPAYRGVPRSTSRRHTRCSARQTAT